MIARNREALRVWLWLPLVTLSLLWACVTWIRRKFYPYIWRYRTRIPTICVGNVHSGGSGKTPLVCAIADHMRGRSPVIVSRGYGGRRTHSGAKVSLEEENGPREYGDEPWMLAQRLQLPVYVGKRRGEVIRVVEALEETRLIIMDDGFQHLAVHRDLDIVVVNGDKAFDDRFCIPFGELREPLSAMDRATAICLTIGEGDSWKDWKGFLSFRFPKIPLFEVARVFEGVSDGQRQLLSLPGGVGIAFCGIGDPLGFQALLPKEGEIVWGRSFPDHFPYDQASVDELLASGRDAHASYFITTEKDWVKTAAHFRTQQMPLFYLRLGYRVPEEFWSFLDQRLESVPC